MRDDGAALSQQAMRLGIVSCVEELASGASLAVEPPAGLLAALAAGDAGNGSYTRR